MKSFFSTANGKARPKSQKIGHQTLASITLREIALDRLKKCHSGATPVFYKKGHLEFWRFGNHIFQPHADAGCANKMFWTNISLSTIEKTDEEGANFMGIKFDPNVPNLVTIYTFSPAVINKYFRQAGTHTKSENTWTIRVFHEDDELILRRVDAKNVNISCNADDSYSIYELTEAETQKMLSAISAKTPLGRSVPQQTPKSIKAYVKAGRNSVKFNGTTPRVIAIMGALAKDNIPLRIDDVISGMLDFGVLPLKANEKSEVSGILQKMLRAGIVFHPDVNAGKHKYMLSEDVAVNIIF